MGRPNFNPRSREGSDSSHHEANRRICEFQSALPRGERLRSDSCIYNFPPISIRAPARGATVCPRTSPCAVSISIRAPARGATLIGQIMQDYGIFQSALPRGERLLAP